jgi:hypothetical protein
MGFSEFSMFGTYVNLLGRHKHDRGAYFLDYNFVAVVLVVVALICKVITQIAKKI